MDLLPIQLTAQKGNWQRFMGRKNQPSFLNVRDQIFARDEYGCRYCGFQANQYQEILNIDQNYDNMALENLATACSLCAQCFFIDSVGLDGKSGGTIVYLPEISQADVNHFCRTVFCSLLQDTPYKGKLQTAYLSLLDRAKFVEEVFGPNSQDPIVFGHTLIDSDLTPSQKNHAIFQELKLIPTRKYFKTHVEYWKSTVFANIPL